jgi:hypothetical protein
MQAYIVSCPKCHSRLKVSGQQAVTRIRCPKCQTAIAARTPSAEEEYTVAAEPLIEEEAPKLPPRQHTSVRTRSLKSREGDAQPFPWPLAVGFGAAAALVLCGVTVYVFFKTSRSPAERRTRPDLAAVQYGMNTPAAKDLPQETKPPAPVAPSPAAPAPSGGSVATDPAQGGGSKTVPAPSGTGVAADPAKEGTKAVPAPPGNATADTANDAASKSAPAPAGASAADSAKDDTSKHAAAPSGANGPGDSTKHDPSKSASAPSGANSAADSDKEATTPDAPPAPPTPQVPVADVPIWKADSKLLQYLGEPMAIEGTPFRVRLPKGYTFHPGGAPAMRTAIAPNPQIESRQGGGRKPMNFHFAVMTPMLANTDDSDEEAIEQSLRMEKGFHSDWTQTNIEYGMSNGIVFARLAWTGTETRTKTLESGVEYRGRSGNLVIEVSASTKLPPGDPLYRLIDIVILTLERVPGK